MVVWSRGSIFSDISFLHNLHRRDAVLQEFYKIRVSPQLNAMKAIFAS
jgi:hypothetical protein